MHKEIIVNAFASLIIAYVTYIALESSGTLDFDVGFMKAKVAGGFATFAIAYYLINKTYLHINAQKLIISGNVSDETGKGIFGALVFIQGTASQVSTNNVGFFSIEAEPKKEQWTVKAEHDGYESNKETVTKKNLADVAITLKKKSPPTL